MVEVAEQPGPTSAPDGGPRVVLHVGLPKTGTTWLQSLLAAHRDRLRAGGVLYPFLRPGAMFHGAVEVRGSHDKFGLMAEQVAGTWAALCERAREHPGTTILSHEVLGGATPEQVRSALAPLSGLPVRVVVTARDLGRQATAHWQEEVKLGATWSFAEFEAAELRADTGPDAGPDAGGVRPRFWHAQDHADALRRWTEPLGAEHGHLVVCPPPGAPAGLLWERFAGACGVPAELVDPTTAVPRNPSLGAAEIALLRAVNAAVALAAGDRLSTAERHRLVKREYAERQLAARSSPSPVCPAALAGVLGEATDRWRRAVQQAGHPVHGAPADLTPVLGGPCDAPPDVPPPAGEDPEAIAARLLAGASGPAAPAGSARPGLAARLRHRLRGPGRA